MGGSSRRATAGQSELVSAKVDRKVTARGRIADVLLGCALLALAWFVLQDQLFMIFAALGATYAGLLIASAIAPHVEIRWRGSRRSIWVVAGSFIPAVSAFALAGHFAWLATGAPHWLLAIDTALVIVLTTAGAISIRRALRTIDDA